MNAIAFPWTLLIIAMMGNPLGEYGPREIHTQTIAMKTKEACAAAAETFAEASPSYMSFFCVSGETGEVAIYRGAR